MKIADGEAMFTRAPLTHVAKNEADTPFRNVTVELLQPKQEDAAAAAEARGVEAGHGALVETLFLHDGVKTSDVILNAGAMLPMDKKAPPRLLVAVSSVRLRDHNSQRAIDQSPGGFAWVPGGPSMLANAGDKPAHFVMLEFD